MQIRRKIFFNCLLMAALVLSIFCASKVTVILNIPIACSFFIFPVTYLCLSVLNELSGTKKTIISLLSAVCILILTYITITVVINLPNQTDTINEANALTMLLQSEKIMGYYIPSMKMIVGSTIGLLVSGLILIGIYSLTSKYTFKTMSCFLATLVSLIIFNTIYVCTTKLGVLGGQEFIMMMLNRFIFSVIWTAIISILFLVFSYTKKEKVKIAKEEISEKTEVKKIENNNIKTTVKEKETKVSKSNSNAKKVVSKTKTSDNTKKVATKPKSTTATNTKKTTVKKTSNNKNTKKEIEKAEK